MWAAPAGLGSDRDRYARPRPRRSAAARCLRPGAPEPPRPPTDPAPPGRTPAPGPGPPAPCPPRPDGRPAPSARTLETATKSGRQACPTTSRHPKHSVPAAFSTSDARGYSRSGSRVLAGQIAWRTGPAAAGAHRHTGLGACAAHPSPRGDQVAGHGASAAVALARPSAARPAPPGCREGAFEPADQLGLGDTQFRIARRGPGPEGQRQPVGVGRRALGEAVRGFGDGALVDLGQRRAAGLVEQGAANLVQQLLDHRGPRITLAGCSTRSDGLRPPSPDSTTPMPGGQDDDPVAVIGAHRPGAESSAGDCVIAGHLPPRPRPGPLPPRGGADRLPGMPVCDPGSGCVSRCSSGTSGCRACPRSGTPACPSRP